MKPTLKEIREATAKVFEIDIDELVSHRQGWAYSHPRQVAFHVAHKYCGYSLARIGRAFGGMDHTTVSHGVRAVIRRNDRCEADAINEILLHCRMMREPKLKILKGFFPLSSRSVKTTIQILTGEFA